LLDRLHQPIGFDKLIEDILQDILYILIVADALSDEIAQARLCLADRFSDPLIFLIGPSIFRQRVLRSTSVDESAR
jgi:hypothetical protein